jgi:serine protease Do
MISRFAAWIGGGLLTGALALTSSGSPAHHSRVSVLQAAQQECARTEERLGEARDRLQDALAALETRWSTAPALAGQAVSASLEEMERALAEAQSEAPQVFEWSDDSEGPGWLGIRMEEVGSAKSKEWKLPAERGVIVTYVTEDSPAAKAGLKVNDVITEFDGQRVEGTLALQRLVREVPAGRSVSITVWRDGQSQSLRVEIGSRRHGRRADRDMFFVEPRLPDMDIEIGAIPPVPPAPAIAIGPMGRFRLFGSPLLGIDAEDLSGQLGNYFGAPDGQGILVREVVPDTPAEKAGLKAGDVIVRVDGKRVKNADELRSALRDKQAKTGEGAESDKTATADLTVLRAGKETVVKVELQSPAKRVRPVRRVAV